MATFTKLTSRIVPLLVDNIDTDQIIPARFLKVTDKKDSVNNCFVIGGTMPTVLQNRILC